LKADSSDDMFRVIIFHPVLVIREIIEHSCKVAINYNTNEPN